MIKVKEANDRQGHLVCIGKLALLKSDKWENLVFSTSQYGGFFKSEHYSPMHACKILALSEHLSPEHYKMIIDGKLNDGDEVCVECNHKIKKQYVDDQDAYGYDYNEYSIKLNHEKHITLFLLEKECKVGGCLMNNEHECFDDGCLLEGRIKHHCESCGKEIPARAENIFRCEKCLKGQTIFHTVIEEGKKPLNLQLKEDTWADIENEYMKEHPPFSAPYPKFEDWLKHNYHAPKRKTP